MLQVTVEDDVPRINYLVEFNEHLKTDEFPVLVDLIPVQQVSVKQSVHCTW